jgi:NitT/TauT family transport system permease protein
VSAGAWKAIPPLIIAALALVLWHAVVVLNDIPPYLLPGPLAVLHSLIDDRAILLPSLLITLKITALALLAALIGGVALAILFAQSRLIEISLFPYAVILQVTPIVAIAPLILVYVPDTTTALLICAWIVAFFPILSNTTLGLNSVDRNLIDLMKLCGATRWQMLWHLRLPAASPYFLAGLRIAGGLSLIGAVVAEFAAGAGGTSSGLAYRILEAGYRLNIPRMFAGLALISSAGIAIYSSTSLISYLALRRWHESQVRLGD